MITAKLNRILVPSDFSETANHALRYASDLAHRIRASISVVYADTFVPPIDFTGTVGAWEESSIEATKNRAEADLRNDAETNIDRSVLYETFVRVAPTLEGIDAQLRDSGASMIVMGTHGRTGFSRFVLGSVTEAVMRRAAVPVIAVPPRGAPVSAIRTVVCPVVYDEPCRLAIATAARIAPEEARFIIVRATDSDDFTITAGDLVELRAWVPISILTRCELRILGRDHLAEKVEMFAKDVRADLIVTAEPEQRGAAELFYGSLAERLMQHSDCPVLTVNRNAVAADERLNQRKLAYAVQ